MSLARICCVSVLLLGGLLTTHRPAAANTVDDILTTTIPVTGNFVSPMELKGVAGGTLPSPNVVSLTQSPTGACRGYIEKTPDFQMNLANFFPYLKVEAVSLVSNQDISLVVRGPGGIWCNDDSSDTNPTLVGEWQAGTYELWIGTMQPQRYVPYQLKLSR